MSANATYRHSGTAILSVVGVDAPIVKTSQEFDDLVAESTVRNGMKPGAIERLSGILERRWWDDGQNAVTGAIEAGEKAIAAAGIDRSRVGLLINTSVSRYNLEPSVACEVHHKLGLPTHALNFDMTNACVGFVNGMHVAANMIDAGQIEYAVIVNGEDTRSTQEATLKKLAAETATAEDLMTEFASLTLGSGAAAMVLGPAKEHPDGHKLVGGVAQAATEHHLLCVGSFGRMVTNQRGLRIEGIGLAERMFAEAKQEFDWADMDRYIIHQVSKVHTAETLERLGIDPAKVPLTFPTRGNIGPASVPYTLSTQVDSLSKGDRVLLMGIGSGLNCMCTEVEW